MYHDDTYAAPAWDVHYDTPHTPDPQTSIQIVVAFHHGDVYVDGQYIGQARSFQGGKVLVPVSPGKHTIALHYGGRAYIQQVRVKAGVTAVVKATRT